MRVEAQIDPIAHINAGNTSIRYQLTLKDGQRKYLGVLLSGEKTFSPKTAKRIEILAGECTLMLDDATPDAAQVYRKGQSFWVKGGQDYTLKCQSPVQYVCHLEV